MMVMPTLPSVPAKTVADVIHGTGDAVTQRNTGSQRSNKQRQHGMHLCFDDHQHQSCDRHYQNQNEYSSRHSVFSFSDFLSDLQQALGSLPAYSCDTFSLAPHR